MRTKAKYPMMHCETCGKYFPPKYAEGSLRYSKRKICSRACQLNISGGIRRYHSRPWQSAVLTNATALEALRLRKIEKMTHIDIARRFGVSRNCIWALCNRITWTHLS